MVETGFVFLWAHVVEARCHTAVSHDETGKVREKERRLETLDFAVLSRSAEEKIVQFYSLVGSGARLVLRSLQAQPKVNVVI